MTKSHGKNLIMRSLWFIGGLFFMIALFSIQVFAGKQYIPTSLTIGESGFSHSYWHWESVSDVSQFTDQKGNYCFAVHNDSKVTIFRLSGGKVSQDITLTMPYPPVWSDRL